MNLKIFLAIVLLFGIVDKFNAAERRKRAIENLLNRLGSTRNQSLGDYIDFSEFLGLDYGDRNPPLRKSYDFIVVGAGPAGCAVANSLSKNPDITVLLLELGKSEIPLAQDVPATFLTQSSTDYNFGYVTNRQTGGCLGLIDQRCGWHHGRGLGGSTLINSMIYSRGNWRDFDAWNASGNPGWSWKEVLPYFIKAEDANIRDFEGNGFHGTGGYLAVENSGDSTPLAPTMVEAAQQFGLPYIDYNSGNQLGTSFTQYNTKRGLRWSAARALLNPIRHRKNLHVLTKAWVTKILIDESSNTAYGVEYTRNKKRFRVRAKREVVLSAGAFGSAKLLMLSGVGPEDHLKSLGIQVFKNLPVGESLYEHPGVIGPVFVVNRPVDNTFNIDSIINLQNSAAYLVGRGLFTSPYTESLTFVKTPFSPYPDREYPDVELIQVGLQAGDDLSPSPRNFFRLNDTILNDYFRALYDVRAFMFLPLLMHSRTKGSMTLKSQNPFAHPVFNYNYFEDERDLEALVYGIKTAIAITKQQPFQELGVELYQKKLPGCEAFVFNTDHYWRCYTRVVTTTFYHYIATCKMGPESDPTSVVDARLRMHGMKNLRVVDAGIIPRPPSAHLVAIAYMIGDKGADMIKEDNGIW
ncbi:glucose dehydrogenase [FAD, quinone]-like [Uranotaenia lowii]|uniref:glucose dehydrogenase [FAD, quinone]-like n=1 Tax=Uranotaenia lowii TaxID=190385 RepID=UPI00247A62CA|nr:glucose dehydrogenase [FAD, quinone]-like [Uranotaenia lowii]